MTTSPPTDQQLDEIEALTKNIPAGPWTVDDSRAELRGSHGNLLADLWDDRLGAYFAAMHAATPALLAEIRRLKQQRRYLLGVLTLKDARSGEGDRALAEFLGGEDEQPASVSVVPAWEAMYEPGNVSDYLIGYANDEAAAKGAAEAWLRSQKDEVGRLEWVPQRPLDGYDAEAELVERHDDGVDTGPGIAVRRRAAASSV